MPEREGYPSTEQWGRAGWTYVELGEARARYAELVSRVPAFTSMDERTAPQATGDDREPLEAA